MKASRSYQKDLIHDLKDTREAIAYLNAAMEAGEKNAFLMAIRNVAEAQGGMSKIAKKTDINRVSLYKMTSGKGNPGLMNIITILHSLGFRLKVSR
ncbi:putative addiction module antidote protein [bacterium]|nr:putative addiction module antidote protein [bacterium]